MSEPHHNYHVDGGYHQSQTWDEVDASHHQHTYSGRPDVLKPGLYAAKTQAAQHDVSTQADKMADGYDLKREAPGAGEHYYMGYSHKELYDFVHSADPGQAHTIAAEWTNIGNEMVKVPGDLKKDIQGSEDGWRGGAAEGARQAIANVANKSGRIGEGAQLAGKLGDEQANALLTAQQNMDPPPDKPYNQTEANQAIATATDPKTEKAKWDKIKADQDAAHQQAADAIESYDHTSTSIAERQPAFAPAPPPIPGKGGGDGGGSTGGYDGLQSHSRERTPNVPGDTGDYGGTGNTGNDNDTGNGHTWGGVPDLPGDTGDTGDTSTDPQGGGGHTSHIPHIPGGPGGPGGNDGPSPGPGGQSGPGHRGPGGPIPGPGGRGGGTGDESGTGGRRGGGRFGGRNGSLSGKGDARGGSGTGRGGSGGTGRGAGENGSGNSTRGGGRSGAGGRGAANTAEGGTRAGRGAGERGGGRGGRPMMGGRGRGGQGEDDYEHETPDFLEGPGDDFWSPQEKTAPPVIGDWWGQYDPTKPNSYNPDRDDNDR